MDQSTPVSGLKRRTKIWGDSLLLTSLLDSREAVTLYCELAPTGPVHLGILRMLIQMDILRSKLTRNGAVVILIIRINDRYSVRRGSFGATEDYIGRGIIDTPDREESDESIYTRYFEDLQSKVAALDIQVDRWIKVSDLYADSAFQDKLWLAWREREAIEQILRNHADRFDQMIFPRCANCGRCYLTKIHIRDGAPVYRCACGFSDRISRDINGGLVSFKLESAITWEHLGVDVDFHGADHYDAAHASCEIMETIFRRKCPLNFVINLTLGSDGKVMRKSCRNFHTIAEYKGDQSWKDLGGYLTRVPAKLLWRPDCPLKVSS